MPVSLAASPTLALNEQVNRLWAAGLPVYHLGFGESRFPVHPAIRQAFIEHVDATSYPPTVGIPALREAVATFHRRHFALNAAADQVIVGPGSKALIFAAQVALEADLILPSPSWVSYAPQARLLGNAVYAAAASAADNWQVHLPALQAAAAQSNNPRRALVLNSPNNPTGQMIEPALLASICAWCREEGITILSDEIYALTAHGNRPHRSPANLYPEGTLVFGGLSKQLSLGGWRLGTAVVPPGEAGQRLLAALRVVAGEIWSAPAAPVQHAAVVAYGGDPPSAVSIEQHIADCTGLHALRTRHLYDALIEFGFPCPEPHGAFYLFPSFAPWADSLARVGVTTSDGLARLLLERYQIATLPGTAFGLPERTLSLRLATSYVDLEHDEAAAALLAAWQAGVDGETLLRDHHPALGEVIARFGQFSRDFAINQEARP
jgi:aspartate aminotransferase